MDYYSRYVAIVILVKNTSLQKFIHTLKTIFARHGIPNEARSDNGRQFYCKEFAQFANDWSFKHSTRSP